MEAGPHADEREHGHDHQHGHGEPGHSHGLVDRSILRSREGITAVGWSLAILGLAAGAQLAVFLLTNSVALLADLVHNFGDALTALPLGVAFYLRSFRGEKFAGLFVVFVIFISACVALYETIMRFIHPQTLSHLWVLAAAGAVGFVGNEVAAQVRLRAGRPHHEFHSQNHRRLRQPQRPPNGGRREIKTSTARPPPPTQRACPMGNGLRSHLQAKAAASHEALKQKARVQYSDCEQQARGEGE